MAPDWEYTARDFEGLDLESARSAASKANVKLREWLARAPVMSGRFDKVKNRLGLWTVKDFTTYPEGDTHTARLADVRAIRTDLKRVRGPRKK